MTRKRLKTRRYTLCAKRLVVFFLVQAMVAGPLPAAPAEMLTPAIQINHSGLQQAFVEAGQGENFLREFVVRRKEILCEEYYDKQKLLRKAAYSTGEIFAQFDYDQHRQLQHPEAIVDTLVNAVLTNTDIGKQQAAAYVLETIRIPRRDPGIVRTVSKTDLKVIAESLGIALHGADIDTIILSNGIVLMPEGYSPSKVRAREQVSFSTLYSGERAFGEYLSRLEARRESGENNSALDEEIVTLRKLRDMRRYMLRLTEKADQERDSVIPMQEYIAEKVKTEWLACAGQEGLSKDQALKSIQQARMLNVDLKLAEDLLDLAKRHEQALENEWVIVGQELLQAQELSRQNSSQANRQIADYWQRSHACLEQQLEQAKEERKKAEQNFEEERTLQLRQVEEHRKIVRDNSPHQILFAKKRNINTITYRLLTIALCCAGIEEFNELDIDLGAAIIIERGENGPFTTRDDFVRRMCERLGADKKSLMKNICKNFSKLTIRFSAEPVGELELGVARYYMDTMDELQRAKERFSYLRQRLHQAQEELRVALYQELKINNSFAAAVSGYPELQLDIERTVSYCERSRVSFSDYHSPKSEFISVLHALQKIFSKRENAVSSRIDFYTNIIFQLIGRLSYWEEKEDKGLKFSSKEIHEFEQIKIMLRLRKIAESGRYVSDIHCFQRLRDEVSRINYTDVLPGYLSTVAMNETLYARVNSPWNILMKNHRREALTMIPGADDAVLLGVPARHILSEEQSHRILEIPIGWEIEFTSSQRYLPPVPREKWIDAIIPNAIELHDKGVILADLHRLKEYNLQPTWSWRTQLLMLRRVMSLAGFSGTQADSLQINVGIKEKDWQILTPVMREDLETDAHWLMFNIVAAYVSPGRIERKKVDKVVQAKDVQVVDIDGEKYRRFEYAFCDFENIEMIAPLVQYGHTCLFYYYYVRNEYELGNYNVPELYKKLAALGEKLRKAADREDLVGLFGIQLDKAGTYRESSLLTHRERGSKQILQIKGMLDNFLREFCDLAGLPREVVLPAEEQKLVQKLSDEGFEILIIEQAI